MDIIDCLRCWYKPDISYFLRTITRTYPVYYLTSNIKARTSNLDPNDAPSKLASRFDLNRLTPDHTFYQSGDMY